MGRTPIPVRVAAYRVIPVRCEIDRLRHSSAGRQRPQHLQVRRSVAAPAGLVPELHDYARFDGQRSSGVYLRSARIHPVGYARAPRHRSCHVGPRLDLNNVQARPGGRVPAQSPGITRADRPRRPTGRRRHRAVGDAPLGSRSGLETKSIVGERVAINRRLAGVHLNAHSVARQRRPTETHIRSRPADRQPGHAIRDLDARPQGRLCGTRSNVQRRIVRSIVRAAAAVSDDCVADRSRRPRVEPNPRPVARRRTGRISVPIRVAADGVVPNRGEVDRLRCRPVRHQRPFHIQVCRGVAATARLVLEFYDHPGLNGQRRPLRHCYASRWDDIDSARLPPRRISQRKATARHLYRSAEDLERRRGSHGRTV